MRIGGASTEPREVRVEHPLADRLAHSFPLAQGAVATSGISTRLWRRNDGHAHHLIDPSTGAPAWTGLLQVTAVAPTAVEAEVLAKTAFLGPWRRSPRRPFRYGGILVSDQGRSISSARWRQRLRPPRRRHERDRRLPASLLAASRSLASPRSSSSRSRSGSGWRWRAGSSAGRACPGQAAARGDGADRAVRDRRPRHRPARRLLPASGARRDRGALCDVPPARLDRGRRDRRVARRDPRAELLRPPLDRLRLWRRMHRWTLAVYVLAVAHTLGSGPTPAAAGWC
jgi:hypothetical protein